MDLSSAAMLDPVVKLSEGEGRGQLECGEELGRLLSQVAHAAIGTALHRIPCSSGSGMVWSRGEHSAASPHCPARVVLENGGELLQHLCLGSRRWFRCHPVIRQLQHPGGEHLGLVFLAVGVDDALEIPPQAGHVSCMERLPDIAVDGGAADVIEDHMADAMQNEVVPMEARQSRNDQDVVRRRAAAPRGASVCLARPDSIHHQRSASGPFQFSAELAHGEVRRQGQAAPRRPVSSSSRTPGF
ncbi:hypothetical protein ACIOBK_32560 [Micromonospora chokoriensis]